MKYINFKRVFFIIFLFTSISPNILSSNENRPWDRYIGKILLCQHFEHNQFFYGSKVFSFEFISRDKVKKRAFAWVGDNRGEMFTLELSISTDVDYIVIGTERINRENLQYSTNIGRVQSSPLSSLSPKRGEFRVIGECKIYNDGIKNLVQEMNLIRDKTLLEQQKRRIESYKKNKI